MAVKKKPAAAKPNKEENAQLAKRLARADVTVNAVWSLLDSLLADDGLAAQPLAEKYAQMSGVYFRKIRNGRVLSLTDYAIAVDLCTAARRALRSMDDSLQFADHPRGEQLRSVAEQAHQVLMEHYHLSTKPGRPLPP